MLDFDGGQIGFGNKKEGSAFIQGFTPILPPEPEPPIPDDDNTGDQSGKKSKKVEWVLILSFVFMALIVISFYTIRFICRRKKNKISFKHAYKDMMIEDGHSGGSKASFKNLVKNPDFKNQRFRSINF